MTLELFDEWEDYSQPATGAHLVYGGGPLLNSPKLFGVFVNDPNGTNFPYTSTLSGFLTWIASSDVLAELKEYNVSGSGQHIGDATISLTGSTPPPPPPPPPGGDCTAELNALLACMGYTSVKPRKKDEAPGSLGLPHRDTGFASTVVQDSDLQRLLTDNINAGVLPKPDSETLYVVFLPSSVTVDIGQDVSCQTFCGYHNAFSLNGSPVYYAILPYPGCTGCLGGVSDVDSLTAITTHEIAEAVTDAGADGSGWYDQTNGEIGDICAWQFREDGGYNVQLLWSNKRNTCI